MSVDSGNCERKISETVFVTSRTKMVIVTFRIALDLHLILNAIL